MVDTQSSRQLHWRRPNTHLHVFPCPIHVRSVSLGSKSESTLYYLLRIQDEDGVSVSVEGGR